MGWWVHRGNVIGIGVFFYFQITLFIWLKKQKDIESFWGTSVISIPMPPPSLVMSEAIL